jgi:hypothetical protein|tara:strand:+ start:6843 stop:7556 length:714 start_codon:yes stop_codon:yes gene_type:complete
MSFFKKNIESSKRAKKDIFEIASIKNQIRTQPCFLVGSGPSLMECDLKAVEDSGFPIFCINNSFSKIAPDIWLGIDGVKNFHPSIFSSPCIKLTQWPLRYEEVNGTQLCDLDNFYFFNTAEEDDHSFAGSNITFHFEGNTFSTAIHILNHIGFEKICLIGCDFTHGKGLRYNPKSRKKSKFETWNNACTDYLDVALDFLKFSSEKGKSKYISCGSKSRANDFLPYMTTQEAIAKYQS